MSDGRDSFFIIDAYSVIHKVFHGNAISQSRDGLPNNAIGGMINALEWLPKNHKIDYVVSAWSPSGKTFRHEIYDQYKANRQPVPDEFLKQIPYIRRVFELFHIPIIAAEGFEADDVIATLARMASGTGWNTTIYSVDKDFRQLLCDRINLFDHRNRKWIYEDDHTKDWGIRPDQVPDFLALMGDVSDNIPGVPGIGKKYARELLTEYDGIEAILADEKELPKYSRIQKVKDNAEIARLSLELTTLKTDIDLDIDLEACYLKWPDYRGLASLCRECGLFELESRMTYEAEINKQAILVSQIISEEEEVDW